MRQEQSALKRGEQRHREVVGVEAGREVPGGLERWLTGPGLISNYDVAAVLSKLLGRTITYRELSFEDNKQAMIQAGVPEPVAEMNAQAFSMITDGDAAWVTESPAG